MKINNKKFLIIAIMISIIITICVIIEHKNNQRAVIGGGSSFKEIGYMKLDEEQKKNIKEVLNSMYIEKDNYAGFRKKDSSEIDIKSTAFGMYLASSAGFEVNKDKVNNYVKSNYKKTYSKNDEYNRAYNLYYNIIIDQSINGMWQAYDNEYFQKQVDEILADISYGPQTLAEDVETTRRVMEIVKDLRICKADIYITNKQKNKIEKGLNKAIKDEDISNSVLLSDISIVSHLLQFDIVTSEKIASTYEELMVNGGFKKTKSSEGPDVSSTYWFMEGLNDLWDVNYYDKEHNELYASFIDSLEIKKGIYTYDSKSTYMDLSVIAQGNNIYYLRFMGDKCDENK